MNALPAWLHSAYHQESDRRAFDVACPTCHAILTEYSRPQVLAGIFCAVCGEIVRPALPPCPFPHEEVTP